MKCKNCNSILPNKSFFVEKGKECIWCSATYYHRKLRYKTSRTRYKKLLFSIIKIINFNRTDKDYAKKAIFKIKKLLC